jgi:hypothetical protein
LVLQQVAIIWVVFEGAVGNVQRILRIAGLKAQLHKMMQRLLMCWVAAQQRGIEVARLWQLTLPVQLPCLGEQ